jgi:REP element-mobilizing transposase RayT
MPILARLDVPGVLHHIIIRGIERRKIFRDNKDRDNFIDRLSDLLPATQTTCYAWAFIPNHAHFLFRSSGEISTLMRRLLTGQSILTEDTDAMDSFFKTDLMGRKKHEWQDTKYVLSYFGKKVSESRKGYLSYVKKGIDQGRRPELTGGGLVRSLGGWSMVKKLRLKGQDRIKGDERILGDSEFVTALLSQAK